MRRKMEMTGNIGTKSIDALLSDFGYLKLNYNGRSKDVIGKKISNLINEDGSEVLSSINSLLNILYKEKITISGIEFGEFE